MKAVGELKFDVSPSKTEPRYVSEKCVRCNQSLRELDWNKERVMYTCNNIDCNLCGRPQDGRKKNGRS